MKDFAHTTSDELSNIRSIDDFCAEWQRYRWIAVAVQDLLQKALPLGAQVLGFLIQIADERCPTHP